MLQVETGCKNIFRFENVLDPQVCDDLIWAAKNSGHIIPDDQNTEHTLSFADWDIYDRDKHSVKLSHIKRRLHAHVHFVSQLIYKCYNIPVYPDRTDIFCYPPGSSMGGHFDCHEYDENNPPKENFKIYVPPYAPTAYTRTVSSVTYLNDDFEGGETIIRDALWQSGDTSHKEYTSVPKKGSVVLYHARCLHWVNQIVGSNRFAIPIFYTDDPNLCEHEFYTLYQRKSYK